MQGLSGGRGLTTKGTESRAPVLTSASQLEMQCKRLSEVQDSLSSQVFHRSSKKTTKTLPKQHVEKKTANIVESQAAALLETPGLLCLRGTETFPDIIGTSSAAPLPLFRVQDLLTFTSASLFIVSRRAFWNAVISKQQVACMLAI